MIELKAKQIAEILHGTVDGDPETIVNTMSRIETAKAGSICFYANPKYEEYLYTNKASVVLVNKDFQPSKPVDATLVRVDDAYTAVASFLEYVTAQKRAFKRYRGCGSRTFFSTKLGKKVYLGDGSYVGRHSSVGDYTKIFQQVYIGDNVTIGRNCIIYPGVKIYSGMVIGNNVIIQANAVIGSDGFGFAPQEDGTYKKIEHTGNVIIEDDVEIGANTTVDKSQMGSTIIHKGVKVDNLCQIAHNVEIGENSILCGQVGLAGSTKIGKSCILAGQAGVAGHLTIADHTTLGAQTGVISSIKEEGQTYLGSPAILHSDFMRSYIMFRKSGRRTQNK